MSKRIVAVAARLALAAFLVVLLSLGKPAIAQVIPALAMLSDTFATSHPDLVKWRAALVEERNLLRERARQQTLECGAVEEGSALEASCLTKLAALKSDTHTHIEKSDLFNSTVHDALTQQGNDVNGTMVKPAFAQVNARGEFYFLTRDGRKLAGQEANSVPLEEGGTLVTGSDGHVRLVLPDETVFTLGPDSTVVIDRFAYDPASDEHTIMARLKKGIFRWVTGKTARKSPEMMKVTLPGGDVGVRGTDFEATVEEDGSGAVVLYSGQLQITEAKTERIFVLNAGETVTFGSDGIYSLPRETQ